MSDGKVNEYTDLTCTNLMIPGKILENQPTMDGTLLLFPTREQVGQCQRSLLQ